MAYEYQMLTYMTLFFLFAWFPSSMAKKEVYGFQWLASNRKPVEGKVWKGWHARSELAYNNLKDYFPAFVVAVLLLGINGKFDYTTKWATTLFVIGRIFHFISYLAGNVILRFAFYLIAMAANIFLLIKLILL
ncbi:MAG: MAPEG family protein [Bacteriovoracaceae bacterium]